MKHFLSFLKLQIYMKICRVKWLNNPQNTQIIKTLSQHSRSKISIFTNLCSFFLVVYWTQIHILVLSIIPIMLPCWKLAFFLLFFFCLLFKQSPNWDWLENVSRYPILYSANKAQIFFTSKVQKTSFFVQASYISGQPTFLEAQESLYLSTHMHE